MSPKPDEAASNRDEAASNPDVSAPNRDVATSNRDVPASDRDVPSLLDGDRVWTRGELEREIEARAKGLPHGGRIALQAKPSAETVVEFLACLQAGVTVVPLGQRLTEFEREAIRSAAGIGSFGGALDPNPPAVIVPTSGTTARPKLVRLNRAQLEASADAWMAVLPPATGWLLSLGLAHVSGIGIVVRAWRAGVPIVIPAAGEALVDTVARARARGIAVSHVSLVPAQMARLLDLRVAPPPELRVVILGGAPIPESVVVAATAAGWPVVPSYGLTETASGCVAVPVGEAAARPWSAGRPMPGVELRIGAPNRDGLGEIQVRGPMVFSGYEGDAALTEAALDGDGWLHTGDLGSVDQAGWLRVSGRRDELIISGGENVSPAEVEEALAAHPGVADVAVTAAPDERWGSVPVALFVPREARPADGELRVFARERLASFKVPARFVETDTIPRTSNGKLLRRRLPVLLRAAGHRAEVRNVRVVETDDGQLIGYRDLPGPRFGPEGGSDEHPAPGSPTRPTLLMVHGTLLASGRTLPLARLLQSTFRVVAVDRRGTGSSQRSKPGPVPIGRHLADLIAVLDDAGVERAAVFGHSFGANLSLELAARHPDRVASVVAYEPPYLALADPELAARMAPLPAAVAAAFAAGGSPAAAEAFLRTVIGDDAWESFTPPQRALSQAEGAGALADSDMSGLDPDGLARIQCPVLIATGAATEPFYLPLADALAARIPTASRVTLPGLAHAAPMSNPEAIAALVVHALPV